MQTTSKQISPASVIVAISTVEKSFDDTMKALSFDEKGNVTVAKGKTVSAMEAGIAAGELVNGMESARIKSANLLRYTRTLPAIEGVPAFDVAMLQFRNTCKSEGEFSTVKKVVPLIDICVANGLKISPFVLAEVVGTLNLTAAFVTEGEGEKAAKTLRLTDAKDHLAAPIIAKLRDGTATANKIRETVKSVKEEKEKREAAAAEKAKAALQAAGATPPATPAPAPATPPPMAGEENVRLAIHAATLLWDKKIGEGIPAQKMRDYCKQSLEALAKLGGFKLSPL